jgi:hypothetical protein
MSPAGPVIHQNDIIGGTPTKAESVLGEGDTVSLLAIFDFEKRACHVATSADCITFFNVLRGALFAFEA